MKWLAWHLKRKPILLLYFAYYDDSANSSAEHLRLLPIHFCLPLNAKPFTLCEGQILAWYLHFCFLGFRCLCLNIQEISPFKLKGELMFLSIAAPSCIKSGILKWFAGFRSGRCSIALVQYAALMWQWVDANIPTHWESGHLLPVPGCSDSLLCRCLTW